MKTNFFNTINDVVIERSTHNIDKLYLFYVGENYNSLKMPRTEVTVESAYQEHSQRCRCAVGHLTVNESDR